MSKFLSPAGVFAIFAVMSAIMWFVAITRDISYAIDAILLTATALLALGRWQHQRRAHQRDTRLPMGR